MSPELLPPGQHLEPLERFGLPAFAQRLVQPPTHPTLAVTGLVRRPQVFALADLLSTFVHQDREASLHCVTTWTASGHVWSGPLCRDVLAHLDALVQPHPSARWLVFSGLDGYRHSLLRQDVEDGTVLLADRLDGRPLPPRHGAPVRLVAPDLYGYTWVKHLVEIEYSRHRDAGSARWMAHPRGRVWREERSAVLPGWLWRRAWGRLLPRARRAYRVPSDRAEQ